MNLSVIAFGAMAGFAILFVAAMFLIERNSRPADFPKSDIAEAEDENPFEVSD
jgi:hypothetical protein